MTRNNHSNQLELSIHPRSGVDSGQWDWGITYNSYPFLIKWFELAFKSCSYLNHNQLFRKGIPTSKNNTHILTIMIHVIIIIRNQEEIKHLCIPLSDLNFLDGLYSWKQISRTYYILTTQCLKRDQQETVIRAMLNKESMKHMHLDCGVMCSCINVKTIVLDTVSNLCIG